MPPIKAPFLLPPHFLADFGYRCGRRFVGLFWEPCGDEACYDDGHAFACGMSDNWLFLWFVRQSEVVAWLDGHGIRLGDSERDARHWLVVDAHTSEVYAAPVRVSPGDSLPSGAADVNSATSRTQFFV